MYLMIVVGVLVCSILLISVCKLTVSNAFDMSRAMASVRFGGLLALKPVVMVSLIVCSAVVVEYCFRKPCWCGCGVKLSVMEGRRIFSRVLAMGDKRAIGR